MRIVVFEVTYYHNTLLQANINITSQFNQLFIQSTVYLTTSASTKILSVVTQRNLLLSDILVQLPFQFL